MSDVSRRHLRSPARWEHGARATTTGERFDIDSHARPTGVDSARARANVTHVLSGCGSDPPARAF